MQIFVYIGKRISTNEILTIKSRPLYFLHKIWFHSEMEHIIEVKYLVNAVSCLYVSSLLLSSVEVKLQTLSISFFIYISSSLIFSFSKVRQNDDTDRADAMSDVWIMLISTTRL